MDDPRPRPDDFRADAWKSSAVHAFTKWLFGRDSQTVALFLLGFWFAWFVHYEMPSHLKILAGALIEIQKADAAEREKDRMLFRDLLKELQMRERRVDGK